MTQQQSLPWHQGIADWAAETYGSLGGGSTGPVRRPPQRGLPFAPFEAHRPERFHTRPVVLLVLSRSAVIKPCALTQAVELVRISTNGFRVVAFTDSYEVSRSIRPEWPVEQALPEEAWLTHRRDNWLVSAAEHCAWAAEHYGADYVLAPRDPAEAAETVRMLAHAYNAQPAVLQAAIERLAQTDALEDRATGDDPMGEGGTPPEAAVSKEQFGFRGGWKALGIGEHHRRFLFDDGSRVEARITVGEGESTDAPSSGVLLGVADAAPVELLGAVHDAGWSSVLLSPGSTGFPSVDAVTGGVLRACLDALPSRGTVVVIEPAANWDLQVGERAGSLRQETEREENGRWWRLNLSGVGVLRFRGTEVTEAFAKVGRIVPAGSR